MAKINTPVPRRFQWLDGISEARRASMIRRVQDEVRSCEASILAMPINASEGYRSESRSRMISQVMDIISEKRARIAEIERLSGDELCEFFCPREISEALAQNTLRVPAMGLARGDTPSAIVPGMY